MTRRGALQGHSKNDSHDTVHATRNATAKRYCQTLLPNAYRMFGESGDTTMKTNSNFGWRVHPFAPALGALLFLGGCASAKFIPTGEEYPDRGDDCSIEVFSSRIPDRDYVELGIVEGEGSLGKDSLEHVLPKMKVAACQAGGDAIILTSNHKSVDVFSDGSDDQLNVTATVIRWRD